MEGSASDSSIEQAALDSAVILHELPGGVVVESAACLEDETMEVVGQAEHCVAGGRMRGERFATVAVVDAAFAAGLKLQGDWGDQRGEVGVVEEYEAVIEFEVARN